MPIAVAFLTVKALASCAGLPRDLIVHGAAFFTSFAARVALAFAFLMLKDNNEMLLSDSVQNVLLDFVHSLSRIANIRVHTRIYHTNKTM